MNPVSAPFTISLTRAKKKDDQREEVVAWLKYWLHFQKECGKFGCVVFDIDDTLVDHDERIIPPSYSLYKFCLRHGFKCNIVTARPDRGENRRLTKNMLTRNGIFQYDKLYLMPPTKELNVHTISAYKKRCRDEIANTTPILANIGDMWWDLLRYPLSTKMQIVKSLNDEECGILFPLHAHGEVAIKLPGRLD